MRTVFGATAGSVFAACCVLALYAGAEMLQRLILGHW